MTAVKNMAGLAILLGAFALGFIFFLGLFIFGAGSLFALDIGLLSIVALVFAAGGLYMTGGVFYYFFRNFSWNELMKADVIADRTKAPVAIEIRYDKEKKRRYLVDSRHSPRSANPRNLGRGIFIMTRRRGSFSQDSDVIILADNEGSKIQEVRDFEDMIHFEFKETSKKHTIAIAGLIEHSANFETKDSWEPLESRAETREQLAELWADALKKAA